MEKKIYLAIVSFLLSCFVSSGQQRLTGTVVDTDGKPVVGAAVIEKGTSNGAVTGVDGRFSISSPVGATLEISFLGYETKQVTVGAATALEVILEQEVNVMDEVVVVGYGVARKADLTGAIASVGGEQLSNLHSTSVTQALQGAMPGVQVSRTSGLPGAEGTIRVRRVTTIGDSDPLIIVDGIPGDLSMDVSDIESITVLKDAASASIYGARAAAGVIIVTTKRATEGTLNIDYSGSYGFVRPTEYPEPVDYKTYMYMINEVSWNDSGNTPGGNYPVYSRDYIEDYAANNKANPDQFPITNWRKYLVNKTAPTTKHNVTITYGNSVIQSKVSAGYEKTDALYDNRSYTAVTARVNNNIKINKWLSASVDASYLRGISENPVANPLRASYLYGPLWTPVWSDGRISGGRNGTNIYAQIHEGGYSNTWRDNITGKFSLTVTPLKGLTVTGVYAPTIYFTKGKDFTKQISYYDADDPTRFAGYISGHEETSLEESRREVRTETSQVLINYAEKFGKHNLSVLGGFEQYYSFTETLGAGTTGMEISEYPYLNRANLNNLSVSGTAYENAYRSFFGRVGYDYDSKYLFQANIRLDSSSRFDKDYRPGVFPSFSAGWVITEESFIKDLDFNALSFAKVRASWGSLGNERIGNYPYQATMAFSNTLFTDGSGNLSSSMTASQRDYNVRNITWETTEIWDVGIDLLFLKNRLSLTADYYKKTTRDMLLEIQLPVFMGYDNPEQNGGTMWTKGWDLQVGWKDRRGAFDYSVSAHVSNYKSVMGNLAGTVFDGAQIIREGSSYYEWYGYLSDGLYMTQEDVDNSPSLMSVSVGDVKYKDISGPDGVPDGIISADYDRVLLGSSLPRYQYGGTISMGYKGFDLSMVFQGVGKYLRRITSDMVDQPSAWHTFPDFIVGKYYSHYNTDAQNARARYPRLTQTGDANNYQMSDFWLFNGAYFRMKNITIGYTFPKRLLDKAAIKNLRIYASVSDVFTFDKYPKGWDPEANTNGSAYIGQTYNFGIQIKL